MWYGHLKYFTTRMQIHLYCKTFKLMFISNTEKNIVTLLFHPRIIKSLKKYCARGSSILQDHHCVEFACRRNNNFNICTQLQDWIHQQGLHIVATNLGIINVTETRVLALDVVLARPEQEFSNQPQLVMCTVVVDCHISHDDVKHAYEHTCVIHNTLNNFYSIRCRSVLLCLGTAHTFSEMWS